MATNLAKNTTKVVITGGLGFIFSHVTEYLVDRGYEVLVVDDLSEGSHPELKDVPTHFIRGDASTVEVMYEIEKYQPEYIIHAAAYTDVDRSIKEPAYVYNMNTKLNQTVFDVARAIPCLKKLVYISTDEVYGECDHKKTEEEILFPRNPYAASKAAGSLLRITYVNSYPELKDKTTETRFCNVFGERQDDRKILSAIKTALKNDTRIPIHNGGKGAREYIYVKNIPPIVEKIMLEGTRVYNITNNDLYTVNDLVMLAEQVTGKYLRTVAAERPGMDLRYQMSSARVKQEFGWSPEWSFIEGLSEYLND